MKTNLVKKILSIAIVSLVIALVLVVVVLALIPKRLENPIASGYASITAYKGNIDQTYYYTPNTTNEDAVKENGRSVPQGRENCIHNYHHAHVYRTGHFAYG